jgi:peptidoglycan/xylan/chitin deacetylase (PgdA/CDA1 family)
MNGLIMKSRILSRFLDVTNLRPLIGRAWKWSGVLALNYHRIGDGNISEFDRALWSASTEAFDIQVGWLKKNFDVVSPSDLADIFKKRNGRYVLITFDDGYRDNYSAAFQILKHHRVPATFFVTTGFIDQPRVPWWDEIAWMVRASRQTSISLPDWHPRPLVITEPDREKVIHTLLRTYKSIPTACTGDYLEALGDALGIERCALSAADELWMSWDMLREMQSAGMTVGGHTVTHPILARMPREAQQTEIQGCARRLAEELTEPMRYFSYPVGGKTSFNTDTRECLKDHNVQFAFSYYGGYQSFDNWDEFDIRRLSVESDMPHHLVRARITFPQLFGKTSNGKS